MRLGPISNTFVSGIYAASACVFFQRIGIVFAVCAAFLIFTTAYVWFNAMSKIVGTRRQKFWVAIAVFGSLAVAACIGLRNDPLIMLATCTAMVAAGCWAIWANRFCERCENIIPHE